MTSFSHLLGSSTKIPMLIPEYYDQWADRMEDYLNGIDEELWNCIDGTVQAPANVQPIGASNTTAEVLERQNRMKKNEKRCMRELRGALPPVVYNYIRSCKTAKEIWITLKEKYQGSEKTKINSVKQCLVELKEFRQKETESLEAYYDCLNELVYRCNSLNHLYNQLKTHECEVLEMYEDSKQSIGGPLALVSKVSEVDVNEKDDSDNEGFFMNSDDEAVATDAKSGVTKTGGEVRKKMEKAEEKQKDAKEVKKLKGDLGIYCHYCNELRAKTKGVSLVVKGEIDDEESGT
ncbi:uncharacterized protein LOC128127868 [Lactuca sativa]|uniref:uncharacterized protein LOC128127868 n=1 Tax=Lactuca sativa TaxID=4236 RepID=UPI0022AF2A49|nr:uncharacterized protein LOC128127868 [Lactuca sativa]